MESGGEFADIALDQLFTVKGNPQLNKDSFEFAPNAPYPYFTRSVLNNGIAGYVNYLDEEHKIKGNCLAVGMLGMQFFYMEKEFYAGQFTKSVFPKENIIPRFNSYIAQYFIVLLNRFQSVYQGGLVRDFEKTFKNSRINLPLNKKIVDVNYMESYIREIQKSRFEKLQAYLQLKGSVYNEPTAADLNLLTKVDNRGGVDLVNWRAFKIKDLFAHIEQGSRLTKADQKSGKLPFVMSGVTDSGVVGHISNEVRVFPKNSLTIDIFGNVFFRNYSFGASDDVGVYWNDEYLTDKTNDSNTLLFISAALQRSLAGSYSYGNKLRASKSYNLTCYLPIDNDGFPDYSIMNKIISIIYKEVLRKVVDYVDKKTVADNDKVDLLNVDPLYH